MAANPRDAVCLGDLAECYWRYLFHAQSVGPTTGYHDSQTVNRFDHFGLSSVAWLGSTFDVDSGKWASDFFFTPANPFLASWHSLFRQLPSANVLHQFLGDLLFKCPDQPSISSCCSDFLSSESENLVGILLAAVSDLLEYRACEGSALTLYSLLAVEMFDEPSGSWTARTGYLRVQAALRLEPAKSSDPIRQELEFNLIGLRVEAACQLAEDVRLLPGWRQLPPNYPGDDDDVVLTDEHHGRIQVSVIGEKEEAPYVAARRARELLSVLVSRFGGGSRIDLDDTCFAVDRGDGSSGVNGLSRERPNVVNESVTDRVGRNVRDLYENVDARKRDALIRAAKLHSAAYFETFYPWSEFFGLAYDHSALEAMKELSRKKIDGWDLLETFVVSSCDMRAAFNLAFYADVLRRRRRLEGAANDVARKLYDALTQKVGKDAYLQIREIIGTHAEQIYSIPWAQELFGDWVDGLTSKRTRAAWLDLEKSRTRANVSQTRLLRNQVAHRGSSQAPGQAAIAHALNSRVGNLWCAFLAGAEPGDFFAAKDEMENTGEIMTEQLLLKIGTAFDRRI